MGKEQLRLNSSGQDSYLQVMPVGPGGRRKCVLQSTARRCTSWMSPMVAGMSDLRATSSHCASSCFTSSGLICACSTALHNSATITSRTNARPLCARQHVTCIAIFECSSCLHCYICNWGRPLQEALLGGPAGS